MKHPLSLAVATMLMTSALIAAPAVHDEDPAPETSKEVELEEESGWQWSGVVGLDFCSKQTTYGLIDNPHAILTPSAELSLGNDDYFTIAVGAEAIFDTTNYGAKDGGYGDRRYKYQEFAPGITLSRNWDTASWLGSSLDTAINYTYEYHPDSCKKPLEEFGNPNTQWLNLEVAAGDFWLQPTFTLEYQLMRQGAEEEHNGKGGIYATFSLAHDFDIGSAMGMDEGVLTLTPTVGVGMANRKRNLCDFGDEANDNFMFRDGFATLALSYCPIESVSIEPYIAVHQQLDSTARHATGDDDFVAYAGITLGYSF